MILKKTWALLWVLLGVMTVSAANVPVPFKVVSPECGQRRNPLGVETENIRFSWQTEAQARAVEQQAYQILVASSAEKLQAGEADVWNSGVVKSDASVLVGYQGPALESARYYYWKVRVWINRNPEPQESETAFFLTALKDEKDWKSSQWIGMDRAFPWEDEGTNARLSARYLRNVFRVRDAEIKQAVVAVTGLGLYELYLNGQRVNGDLCDAQGNIEGQAVMMPAPTDFRKTIYYNMFDVTDFLKSGGNAIGMILGNGRYYPMRHHYKPYKWADFGYPKMRLVLTITYADGRMENVISNERWMLTAEGPIVSNNEYDGEEYDATKELGDWSCAEYRPDGRWIPAQRCTIPTAFLKAQPNEPMEAMDYTQPVSINALNDSTYILDMGVNMTGWIRMKVKGKAGQTVKLRFAEALLPDGSLSMANLRDAKVTDKYTLKGAPEGEEWAPRFVTHGFQFVEVTDYPGTPTVDDFMGVFVSDKMDFTGSFSEYASSKTPDSKVFNATMKNAFIGIWGNYKGMPVDCPQRNERQPWLGDRTMGSYGESFLFDNAAFYAKWMQDIEDAQRWDGAIPDVAPAYWNYYSDDITWPAAFFNTCWMLYHQYGDIQPIAKHFDAMVLYMEYMRSHYLEPETGLMTADKYGDWCMPPEGPEIIHSSAPDRITDGKLIATAYFCGLYERVYEFASLLGRQSEVAAYPAYAQALRRAFNEQFYQPEQQCYSNNTVTANVVALGFDMVAPENVAGVCENIRSVIMDKYHGTMASGIIGNQWLFRQLSRHGLGDVAWHLVTTTAYPSFGYMIEQGATSIWELWNGDTANPSMNSRNHVMQLGDLLIWTYEDLAGIKAAAPGFKQLEMAPAFRIAKLNDFSAEYQTPYGAVSSSWKKQDGKLYWDITIPANTSAQITLPTSDKKAVMEGSQALAKSEGVRFLSKDGQSSVWYLPSGTYKIELPY